MPGCDLEERDASRDDNNAFDSFVWRTRQRAGSELDSVSPCCSTSDLSPREPDVKFAHLFFGWKITRSRPNRFLYEGDALAWGHGFSA